MKTKILFLLIFTISAFTVNAQRFGGGILAGINTSQIDGDNWAGYYKGGVNVGVFVNTDFADNWGGQLELKYSGKGSSNGPNSYNLAKIRLQYIDMPVLATYEAIENLKFQAGLSFNFLIKGSYYNGEWFSFDAWDVQPSKFETALTVGVNYRFFSNFDLNFRYSYSLTPVRAVTSTSSYGEGAWFNNVLSFTLYFEIGD